MTNFVYQMVVDIDEITIVRNLVCVVSETRGEADQAMRVCALNWWGYPDSEDNGYWVVEGERFRAYVPCEPAFMSTATAEEVQTIRKFGGLHWLKPSPEGSVFAELQEAIEYGFPLDDNKDAVTKYFGGEVYARLVLEREETC